MEAVAGLGGDLLILGAGGKMGPSLARLSQRSLEAAGLHHRVTCVSRFSTPGLADHLNQNGIQTVSCDLLDRDALDRLPDAPNVLYLAGTKFGTTEAPERTWALNCYLPAIVAERFRNSRIVALSTGNVYPLLPAASGGANEDTPPDPVGEYAQSCLGRERLLQYMSATHGTPMLLVRLNYATDLRYGVLLDIAQRVWRRETVNVTIPWLNVIWQGDANAILLRAFRLAAAPPDILNLTGADTVSVRSLAERFASLFDVPVPSFSGGEDDSAPALLSNAGRCESLFGPPRVSTEMLINWVADWVRHDLPTLGKPTGFEIRNGKF